MYKNNEAIYAHFPLKTVIAYAVNCPHKDVCQPEKGE